jgi:outer membrane protein assembly factor BamD (BamD/ComL family)
MAACSAHKNTAKSRFWQSFTAKYNTYYNGSLAYTDGALAKEKGHKDNFTEMLPMNTVGNKQSRALGKGNFDQAIEKMEKTIKLHSIKAKPEWNKSRRKTARDKEWLGRKEYNPFLWKAWYLMGKAQYQKGEFDEAAATFS